MTTVQQLETRIKVVEGILDRHVNRNFAFTVSIAKLKKRNNTEILKDYLQDQTDSTAQVYGDPDAGEGFVYTTFKVVGKKALREVKAYTKEYFKSIKLKKYEVTIKKL